MCFAMDIHGKTGLGIKLKVRSAVFDYHVQSWVWVWSASLKVLVILTL